MNKLLLTALFSVLILSCELAQLNEPSLGSDEENEIPMIDEPTTIPTSIAAFEQAFHGGSQQNWEAALFTLAGIRGVQECRMDDVMTIKSDGTYNYDNGTDRCGGVDEVAARTGTWKVINEGRNIVFDEGTVNAYTVDVNGFDDGVISLSGQYIGLAIKGVYKSQL